jgi:hypothetical protein
MGRCENLDVPIRLTAGRRCRPGLAMANRIAQHGAPEPHPKFRTLRPRCRPWMRRTGLSGRIWDSPQAAARAAAEAISFTTVFAWCEEGFSGRRAGVLP